MSFLLDFYEFAKNIILYRFRRFDPAYLHQEKGFKSLRFEAFFVFFRTFCLFSRPLVPTIFSGLHIKSGIEWNEKKFFKFFDLNQKRDIILC